MDEMEVKIGAIRTAKLVRYVLDFIGMVLIVVPVIYVFLGDKGFSVLKWELIFAYLKGFFAPGFFFVLMAEYLYYLLLTHAYMVYNSRRLVESSDVIEIGVHRMAGLGYGQNDRPVSQPTVQPVNTNQNVNRDTGMK
ncbi:MAG: hypothetical protein IJM27_01240 [Eubacterium sp.]|nr:hypothetical protein [Eubacterium sp.]